MTIVEAIKRSIERQGMAFLYHSSGEVNELVSREAAYRDSELPVVICHLLSSGSMQNAAGVWVERVQVALFFSRLAEYDFNGEQNEQILERCKVAAQRWLHSLSDDENLRLVSVNSTERVYNSTEDVITAYAVNITIEELHGVGVCGKASDD